MDKIKITDQFHFKKRKKYIIINVRMYSGEILKPRDVD